MVTFICDGCSSTLRKNQVDTHAARCRQCDSVSCVDCSVSFWGDDYRSHTSCMTESERYEGKFAKFKKKRNPQEEWMDVVVSCVDKAPAHLQEYVQTMSTLENIPRKEKQFRNFTANSLRLRGKNELIVGEIWEILKTERERRSAWKLQQQQQQQQQSTEQSSNKDTQQTTETSSLPTSKENRRISAEKVNSCSKQPTNSTRDKTQGEQVEIDAQKLRKAMKKELKKAPNRSMKVKALRKILIERLGLSKTEKKRLKVLVQDAPSNTKSSTRVKIDGKIITLLE